MAESEAEIYNRLRGGMTYQQFLSSGGETALRATARRLHQEQLAVEAARATAIPPVAGGAGPLPEPRRWWKFWHRESREERIERMLKATKGEWETLKLGVTTTAKAVGRAGAVPLGIIESKTVGRVGMRTPFSFVEKPEAAKEIYNIAERVTAQGIREDKNPDVIREDIDNEINKQFARKKYKREWLTSNETISLVNQGAASAVEQVVHYEQRLGGRYAGQAVRKLEQFGAATSTVGAVTSGVAQKTPGLGGMLFGKVPRQPAERVKQLDPAIRSAINEGRIELQKRSADQVNRKLGTIKADLKEKLERKREAMNQLKESIDKMRTEVISEEIRAKSPQAQQEEGTEGGGVI